MNNVLFRTLATMQGFDFTPTPVEGVPGFTLYAADELYLPPGPDSMLVRCGVALRLPNHLYGEFAPLPVRNGYVPFSAHRHVVICDGTTELCPMLHHLGGDDIVHVKPGDPVAILLVHLAPTLYLAPMPSDEVHGADAPNTAPETGDKAMLSPLASTAAAPPVPATETAG